MPALTVSGWLRYDVVRRLMPPTVESVLEIGAGKGALGALLAKRYDYTGLEPDGISFATARAALNGRVLPLRDEEFSGTFDAVVAFEVLEHIEDDVGALVRWREFLRPGGSLFLSVPAGRHRFGPLDEKAGHYRRYDRPDLARVLHEAGFSDVTIRAYGFPIVDFLLAGMNLAARRAGVRHADMETRTAASGRWFQPTAFTAPLARALAWPFAFVQRGFPERGPGYVVRAHRRST